MNPSIAPAHPTSPLQAFGRRLAVNLSFGIAAKLVQFAVGLFLVSYVLHRLGLERYGVVVAATTVAAFLGLIQLGAAGGIARHLNILHSRDEHDRFNCYFSAGALLSLGMAVLIVLVLLILFSVFWPIAPFPAALESEGRKVMVLSGSGVILLCLTLPASACLQAVHRVDVVEKIGLAGALARVVMVVGMFEFLQASAVLYATALFLEQATVLVATWIALRGSVPWARLSLRTVRRATLWEVAGFNAMNLLANLNYVAFMQAPAFLLQRFEGLALAGLYGIGLQLNNLVRGLLTAALNAMTPATISLHAAGNPEHLRKLFRLSTKFFVAVGAVLWVSFYFLGETFLTLWLRRDVSPLVDALPWLMAASAVGVAAMPASVIALALGRLRLPALSGLLLAAGMVGCMTVLRSATGAPVLTEVCAMLAGFFGLYQIVRIIDVARALNFSMGELSGLCFRALAPAGLSAVLLIAASFFWPRASWERLVVTGALALVAGAGGACWFLFSDAERSLLVRFRSAVAAVAPSKG